MKTPEGMEQIAALFHEALELDPQQRDHLLARARATNPELVAEVESLIAAHEGSGSLLDAPAYEAVADSIATTQPGLVRDQIVGHYQIVSPLGKGGMGEVYLANDTKLERKVALKLLPAEFTGQKDRLRRFIQEARAASSLNHPNIITIHEIGEVNGAHFIATEFIDGQTLKHHTAHGKMSMTDLLEIAIQAAGALQAAHAAGIVHRDIKPDNIMIRPDGYVKILDFGLAKLTEKYSSDPSAADSALNTMVKADTKPGTVLGTINYMSPEQARGQMLDQRTDVFSLGVVLYEMAAGRAPFVAANTADMLVSILQKEPPPLADFARDVPAEFQRIISKALRKDREERYQTMKDMVIDLKSLKEELSFTKKLERSQPPQAIDQPVASPTPVSDPNQAAASASTAGRAAPKRSFLFAALGLLAVVGLIVGVTMFLRRGRLSPSTKTASIPAARQVSYRITVQKYRDGKPYQDPFLLSDDINFEKDYRIRLTITSPQRGLLYLLNEGLVGGDQIPTYNVLFPSTTTNNGSSVLAENQQLQIPPQSWFQFDAQQLTETIWLVWSEQEVPELEAVKAFANPKDKGVISSPGLRNAVNEFFKAHTATKPTVERDQNKKETVVNANTPVLVHAIRLEHH